MLILSFTALIEALIKNVFVIAFWKIFLKEQVWNVFLERPFWNAFFEEAIYNTLGNWLKLVDITDNWLKWLLNNKYWLMWLLCAFFINAFTTSKTFLVLTCLNINIELLIIGCSQARFVTRGTCLDCLPPLGKSSNSLGKGWMKSNWWRLE